jgi:Ca-activated chloride channel family protein
MPFAGLELTGLGLAEVLAVLGAFSAIVVVLYLLKLRRRTIEVPFVGLWQHVLAEERTTRLFSTLKRLLSLLIALAIVAVLAIALGDPRASGASERGRTFVVLVDGSASMGATDVEGGRLEAARADVRRRIDAMGTHDRMIVAQMGASTIPLGPVLSDPGELADLLPRLEVRDVAADLGRGLGWALDVARDAPRPEIIVVSDGRVRDPGEAIAARARQSGVPIHWSRIGAGARNVAITAFAVRRYPIDKSRAQVLVELWNPGETAEDVELSLLGDGATIDVATIRIGAGERLPRLFENITGVDRTLEARIRFADGSRDALAADDAAYARLPERRRARIVVVAPGDIYLSAALLLDEYLEVVEVAPGAFPPEGRFDVAIFESFVPRTPYDADTIWLHPLPPEGVEGPLEITGTIERPVFDRIDRDDRLLQFTSLRDVNVAEALAVRLSPGDIAVASDPRGPLIVRGARDGRHFVALTFDPAASDLPLRIAWPLLLLNAIDSFAEEGAGYLSSYRTDETWHVPVEPGATGATLIDPDGVARDVPIIEGRALASGTRAGFYTLRTAHGGDEAPPPQILAASLGPSDEAVLAPPDVIPIAGAPVAPPVAPEIALRSELWVWLVLAAFVMLAIEWATFHRRWTV